MRTVSKILPSLVVSSSSFTVAGLPAAIPCGNAPKAIARSRRGPRRHRRPPSVNVLLVSFAANCPCSRLFRAAQGRPRRTGDDWVTPTPKAPVRRLHHHRVIRIGREGRVRRRGERVETSLDEPARVGQHMDAAAQIAVSIHAVNAHLRHIQVPDSEQAELDRTQRIPARLAARPESLRHRVLLPPEGAYQVALVFIVRLPGIADVGRLRLGRRGRQEQRGGDGQQRCGGRKADRSRPWTAGHAAVPGRSGARATHRFSPETSPGDPRQPICRAMKPDRPERGSRTLWPHRPPPRFEDPLDPRGGTRPTKAMLDEVTRRLHKIKLDVCKKIWHLHKLYVISREFPPHRPSGFAPARDSPRRGAGPDRSPAGAQEEGRSGERGGRTGPPVRSALRAHRPVGRSHPAPDRPCSRNRPDPQNRAVTRNPTPCSGPEPAPAAEPGATLSRRRPSNSSSSEPMSPGRDSRASRQPRL